VSVSIVTNHMQAPAGITEAVQKCLSETAIETAKAQTYHWNVTGMAFGPLHALFQEIYEDHFSAQDRLAERIKAVGGHADGRFSKALEVATITECDGAISAREMVQQLSEDQAYLSSALRNLAGLAEDANDIVTNDMAIERADIHDKFAWMLKAHLEH